MAENQREFKIGLAMSGAISAGSITGAVGALAACRGAQPTQNGSEAFRVLPDLYDAWVAGPDFLKPVTKPDGRVIGSLLSTEDLKDGQSVVSLLNALPLRCIGDKAISAVGAAGGTARPYFPENLHIYLTLTNLRGLPFAIDFSAEGGGGKYGMMCHRDWAHYRLDHVGTARFEGPWAGTDPAKTPLDIGTLPTTCPVPAGPWSAYIENTLASGAFPVGLGARQLENNWGFYNGRHWSLPFPLGDMSKVNPTWPQQSGKGAAYHFATVDGGAIDNDPFQFVRYALMEQPPQPLDRGLDTADRTVIMISPFPEPPELEPNYDAVKSSALPAVIKRLIPMFVQQNRFKPEEIFNALDPDTASRWMISPQRYVEPGHIHQTHGIACGLLGGFGGFLEREFREHDYELGRKNCQDFLARWFGLPTNPNVDGIDPLPQAPGRREGEGDFEGPQFPIVPLCGSAATPVRVRPWPRVPKKRVNDFTAQAMIRLNRIREILTADLDSATRAWLWIGWQGAKSKLEAMVRYTVLGDLIRRDQLDDGKIRGLAPDQIKVLLACIDPAHDYRSAASIAKQLDGTLTEAAVATILSSLKDAGLVDTFWRGIDKNGKLVGRIGTWIGSDAKPIYTYIDRQQPMVGRPSDPSFD